jgi:hypothetical protein
MAAMHRALLVVLVIASGCATGPGPAQRSGEPERLGRWVMLAKGPEIEAAVGYSQAARDLGDPWLLLALEFTAAPGAGVVTVSRSDIVVVTPDGRSLALVEQSDFRASYGGFRVRLERALAILPVLARYDTSRMPCDRWFLADPFAGFAYDQVFVNTFQVCSGPLVFHDPGGVQPGRWRLVIELEESTIDLPFELEPPD